MEINLLPKKKNFEKVYVNMSKGHYNYRCGHEIKYIILLKDTDFCSVYKIYSVNTGIIHTKCDFCNHDVLHVKGFIYTSRLSRALICTKCNDWFNNSEDSKHLLDLLPLEEGLIRKGLNVCAEFIKFIEYVKPKKWNYTIPLDIIKIIKYMVFTLKKQGLENNLGY